MNKYCFFYLSLVQDLQVYRSFIRLFELTRPDVEKYLVLDPLFLSRDKHYIGYTEIKHLVSEYSCRVIPYHDEFFEVFSEEADFGDHVPFFFASESNAAPHLSSYLISKSLPNCFTTITVQHGSECLGFKHSDRMDDLYGKEIEFGSDLIFGWADIKFQTNATILTKEKYHNIGFSNNLFERLALNKNGCNRKSPCKYILLFETIKSDRFHSVDEAVKEFTELKNKVKKWCEINQLELLIKPHPSTICLENFSGEKVAFEYIADLPIDEILFAIATPSTVVLDCVSLSIPVYIWSKDINEACYNGVPFIRNLTDLNEILNSHSVSFEYNIGDNVLSEFLSVDPKEVIARVMDVVNPLFDSQNLINISKSIVFCDNKTASEDIIFDRSRKDVSKNPVVFFEKDFWKQNYEILKNEHELLHILIDGTLRLLECREIFISRLFTGYLPNFLKSFNINLHYFIDDDLLNVPKEIGVEKFKYYNSEMVRNCIFNNLSISDSIISSTEYLAQKLPTEFSDKIYIIDKYIPYPKLSILNNQDFFKDKKTIAFYGTDHAHDFEDCFRALQRLLTTRDDVAFINIGGTQLPEYLESLPNVKTFRIKLEYDIYSALIRSIPIYIGVAPLADLNFNNCKANTKFVEYTACNAVTVSNNKNVYPDSLVVPTSNCALSNSNNWFMAIQNLLNNKSFWTQHLTNARKVVFGEKLDGGFHVK